MRWDVWDCTLDFRNAQAEAWKLGFRFADAPADVWQEHGLPQFDALCREWGAEECRGAIRRALREGCITRLAALERDAKEVQA